jgi:hypothetical protein
MLADELGQVLGVETHRDEHVAAVVTAAARAVVAGTSSAANARGYRALLRVADRYAAGRRAWAIEGSGSYGAGLSRYLAARGELVLEISCTPRTERRLRGKDDALDAARTAPAALAGDRLALPRAGTRREALRLLLVARRSAVDVRREALSQPRAVIATAPDPLRRQLRGLPLGKTAATSRGASRTPECSCGSTPRRSRSRSAAPPSAAPRSTRSARSSTSCVQDEFATSAGRRSQRTTARFRAARAGLRRLHGG